jgi:hypothetical protein
MNILEFRSQNKFGFRFHVIRFQGATPQQQPYQGQPMQTPIQGQPVQGQVYQNGQPADDRFAGAAPTPVVGQQPQVSINSKIQFSNNVMRFRCQTN